jgi:hypothetical protein
MTSLQLSPKEIRILVQSLDNCLATCQTRAARPDAPCEDCDAARELQGKLKKQLPA